MINSKKFYKTNTKLTLIIILLILTIISSGCIHIDFSEPFTEDEKKPTEYRVVTKEEFPIRYEFKNEDANRKHTETKPFNIKEKTEWANVSITVKINNYLLVNNSPINISFFDQYVYVKITDPNDNKIFESTYTESDEDIRPLPEPEDGVWVVWVEAEGFGNDETYDYYEINVIAYEPV